VRGAQSSAWPARVAAKGNLVSSMMVDARIEHLKDGHLYRVTAGRVLISAFLNWDDAIAAIPNQQLSSGKRICIGCKA